jgi:CspA family cold shock protein
MVKGTIKKLVTDRGYGFIKTGGRNALFSHESQFQGVDYPSLKEGQASSSGGGGY